MKEQCFLQSDVNPCIPNLSLCCCILYYLRATDPPDLLIIPACREGEDPYAKTETCIQWVLLQGLFRGAVLYLLVKTGGKKFMTELQCEAQTRGVLLVMLE